MSNIAIRYCTRTGHSRQLAEAIGAALNLPAEDISVPLEEPVDKLFLCNGMYASRVDKQVRLFLEQNADRCGEVVNVCSSATGRSTRKSLLKLAEKYAFTLSGREFRCKGAFHFMAKEHPTEEDLKAAAAFARVVSI